MCVCVRVLVCRCKCVCVCGVCVLTRSEELGVVFTELSQLGWEV